MCTDEIYNFFDSILHSLSIKKDRRNDNDSDDGRVNNNFDFGQRAPMWGGGGQGGLFGGGNVFGGNNFNSFGMNGNRAQ